MYIARFLIDEKGQISYHDTCGCLLNGNSIAALSNGSRFACGPTDDERNDPAFIFCQKRRSSVQCYDIPLTVPVDFNAGGKATIMLRSSKYCYLNFKAEGKMFMPCRGDDLIWETLQDSYMFPVYSGRVGTIELETIKRGEEDTILVSEHITYKSQSSGSGSDSSDGYALPDEETEDILDYSTITTIYSSL